MPGESASPKTRRPSPLRAIRIFVSTAVLVLVVVGAFLRDPRAAEVTLVVARAQLLPALIRWRVFLSSGLGSALFVLPVLLISAYLFGRAYCSSLCPLGTLQDGVQWLARRGSATRFRFHAPRFWLRLGSFVLVMGLWVGGISALVSLVEPYSLVQRVVSVEAVRFDRQAGLPDGTAAIPQWRGETAAIAIVSSVLSFLLLLTVLATAVAKGRLFCNTLCPAGAALSLPSRFSILRIRLSRSRCTSCGLCERMCSARCIDAHGKKIYAGSCVLCFRCIDACPYGAISYSVREKKE